MAASALRPIRPLATTPATAGDCGVHGSSSESPDSWSSDRRDVAARHRRCVNHEQDLCAWFQSASE